MYITNLILKDKLLIVQVFSSHFKHVVVLQSEKEKENTLQ
jgi:hypothetical protein